MHVYLVWKCLPLVKDVHVVSFLTSVCYTHAADPITNVGA